VLRQGYAKLGVSVQFKVFPAERALAMSNAGKSDGELVRIKGIGVRYPNLIWIPVSHVTAEQMAFAADVDVKITGWPSLAPFRLAFHRGYKVAERNTEGMTRHLTGTAESAFMMVSKGRADLAIANRFTGAQIIAKLELGNVVMLNPPVQRNPLYHYLHKKHQALSVQITRVLKDMAASGTIAEIRKKYGVGQLRD